MPHFCRKLLFHQENFMQRTALWGLIVDCRFLDSGRVQLQGDGMKLLPSLLLAAGIGFAGTAAALAAGEQMHQMTIKLPAGGLAHITYSGDKAPKVVIDQNAATPAAFRNDPAFAMFARMQADMNRQMQAMQAMFNDPALWQRPELDNAVLNGTPNNANDMFSISTAKGGNYCMQSVQITQNGNEKPKVVRRTVGNCGGGNASPNATLRNAPESTPQVTTISYR
jgi:hypothetical protein